MSSVEDKRTVKEGIKKENQEEDNPAEIKEETEESIEQEPKQEVFIGDENEETEIKEDQLEEEPVKTFSPDKVLMVTIGLIILFLVFFFASGYVFQSDAPQTINDLHNLNIQGEIKEDKGYMYNGFSFVFNNGLWYTEAQVGGKLYSVALHYGPKELEDIELVGTLDERFFNTSEYYSTFNPLGSLLQYVSLSAAEFGSSMIQVFGFVPVAACDRNETNDCKTVPIITCNNTNESVVYFVEADKPKVILDGNCIKIEGSGQNLVKAADRLLYFLYQIMGR